MDMKYPNFLNCQEMCKVKENRTVSCYKEYHSHLCLACCVFYLITMSEASKSELNSEQFITIFPGV